MYLSYKYHNYHHEIMTTKWVEIMGVLQKFETGNI